MTRADLNDILEGTHSVLGARVALVLHGLILVSALAIALETVQTLPLELRQFLYRFEIFVLGIFCVEYLLRVFSAERPLRYILSFWGIVDLLACLPALAFMQPQWQVARLLRLMRLVRLLKLFRSSEALDRLVQALSLVRGELAVFGVLSVLMLYVSAVGIYLFEHDAQPEAFSSIPKSLWWAVASFTTVGYGDMFPITTGGRIFTSVVLFIGLGIVAVPSAIITTALLGTKKRIRTRRGSDNTTQKGDSDEKK